MNPSLTDLRDLRDIHLPSPVSWWPLAAGWWVLIALVVILCMALSWWAWRRRRNRWRRHALHELSRLRDFHESGQSDSHASIRAFSLLLRRVAVSRFPRKEVAALSGEAWLAFLDQTLGAKNAFTSDQARVLAVSPYVREIALDAGSMRGLFDLGERWLKKLPAGGQK